MAGRQGLHSAENGKKGGRPKSSRSVAKEIWRDELAKRITARAGEWMDYAEGLLDGKKFDANAWAEVLNQAFGTPQKSLDVTSNGKTMGQVLDELEGM